MEEHSGNDSVIRISSDRNISETPNTSVEEGLRSPTSTKWAELTDEMIAILAKSERGALQEGTYFHIIFTIFCPIAILIDPSFLYMNINDGKERTDFDKHLLAAYICLRCATDVIFAIDVSFSNSKFMENFQRLSLRERLRSPKISQFFVASYVKPFIILPLPQLLIWVAQTDNKLFFGAYVEYLCVFAIQFALRVIRIYIELKRRPNKGSVFGSWLKAILDFFPFILAAHFFGAVWYFLAIERQKTCWRNACSIERGCNWHSLYYNMTDINIMNKACPIDMPDASQFDFGIYLYALQSGMTTSPNIIPKMLQGFWWGLRNLSSFGSNLQTSFYWMEIVFATILSISGILLFMIYLNGRLQVAKRNSEELRLTRMMQIITPEIDLWLSKKNISNNKDIKKLIEKVVRKKLEDGKDNIVQNLDILSILPIKHRNYIMSSLRLTALKKVPVLTNANEHVLKAICNHLQPMTYTVNSYILREGEPLWNMLFITEGTALAYKTNSSSNDNTAAASSSNSSNIDCIGSGDFYGDELLKWAFAQAEYTELPITMKTVISQTKLEAFCINATSLKTVVSNFPLQIGLMNLPDLEERLRFIGRLMLPGFRAIMQRRTTGTNQVN